MSLHSIVTSSGRRVEPLALKPADVSILDIAHHLSHMCRFTGATRDLYTVAQHSVLVSLHCDPADALWGLMHDAAEAYLWDAARPVKQHRLFGFFRFAESECMAAICTRFGLSRYQPQSVSIADARLCETEARDLMPREWVPTTEPYEREIIAWTPDAARSLFLRRYLDLTGDAESLRSAGKLRPFDEMLDEAEERTGFSSSWTREQRRKRS